MTSFPLYNNLLENTTKIDLTVDEKDNFKDKIKKIDLDGSERIYAIIRIFHNENNNDSSNFNLPYSGVIIPNKDEIRFDLEKIPFQLKQILFKFINLHITIMEEDTNRPE